MELVIGLVLGFVIGVLTTLLYGAYRMYRQGGLSGPIHEANGEMPRRAKTRTMWD